MQMSIRGVDEKLATALKSEAEKRDTSVNKLVIRLLAEAVATTAEDSENTGVNRDLDRLFGVWSDEDVREFEEATACFSRIDEEMWR